MTQTTDPEQPAPKSIPRNHRLAVSGTGTRDLSDDQYKAIVEFQRIMHDNPAAAKLFTSNLMNSAGYGKYAPLQHIPYAGNWMRGYVTNELGLGGSYLPGWDSGSDLNSTTPTTYRRMAPAVRRDSWLGDMITEYRGGKPNNDPEAAAGVEALRQLIQSNPQLNRKIYSRFYEAGKDKINEGIRNLPTSHQVYYNLRDKHSLGAQIVHNIFGIDADKEVQQKVYDQVFGVPNYAQAGTAKTASCNKKIGHAAPFMIKIHSNKQDRRDNMNSSSIAQIKKAFAAGHNYALIKHAGFLDDVKNVWNQNSSSDDIKEMLSHGAAGAGIGALAGGPGRRVPGGLWGALGAILMSKPGRNILSGILSSGYNNLSQYLSKNTKANAAATTAGVAAGSAAAKA